MKNISVFLKRSELPVLRWGNYVLGLSVLAGLFFCVALFMKSSTCSLAAAQTPVGEGRDFMTAFGELIQQDSSLASQQLLLPARSVFKACIEPQAPEVKAAQVVFDDRQDLLQDLRLVGIIDDDGLRAIIEDNKTSRSYSVRQGENISEFRVVSIENDTVLLESQGTQYNLKL